MTEEIKKKIEDKITELYPSLNWGKVCKEYNGITGGYSEAHAGGFEDGAKFGYSLAEQELKAKEEEIERLKGLIKELWDEQNRYHNNKKYEDELYNRFKERHNL